MTPEETFAANQEQMERIWNIVRGWDYNTYRMAQKLFAPVESEDEDD